MKITDLKPNSVFHWFNELCSIPHGSGNTAAVSQFCANFAEQRGLRYFRDNMGNVIIYKDASADKTGTQPVILQGHLDMVCDACDDRDMQQTGIFPLTDGEYITADGTTLGADDGIAVAYILAILDSDDISHPPIEALLTVDEEIGLLGAGGLDCSHLKGRRLINIDSEEEGILTVGCAGGVRAVCSLPLTMVPADDDRVFLKLTVDGLSGGHSGIEIDKHHQNAIVLLARLLNSLNRRFELNICSFKGGSKMNIIPKSAEAVVSCRKADAEAVLSAAEEFGGQLIGENRVTEPAMNVNASLTCTAAEYADRQSTDKLIFALMLGPDGVVSMNPEIPGMVLASLNTGTAEICGNRLEVSCLVRSNDRYGKKMVVDRLEALYGFIGGTVTLNSGYPAWEYRSDSPLRDTMAQVYEEMFGRKPVIRSIHAGLECGIISDKLPDADMVSIGPDVENAHTVNERLGVASAVRCYEYLLKLLQIL